MRTKEENIKLADMLFPEIKESIEDIYEKYPTREVQEGAMVLRFAPSPTGFLHIGGVYAALVGRKLANQSSGVFLLRIEDTDKGRELEGGVGEIVEGLEGFSIALDEGVISAQEESGSYGPYMQSNRLDIYKVFAKYLVSEGYAYPCFLTEEELVDVRNKQKELSVKTGCYGNWATWRDATLDKIGEMLDAKKDFVIRLYSTGDSEKTYTVDDLIKGTVTLRENDMDAILLKSDGFPTYHLAHPIDDTLMGITHVLRGDEWFSSLALHVELFEKLGMKSLPYGHFPPLMKLDDGNRRKLSKRKDPEADATYYIDRGYPIEGVKEYLLNIANSNFYDWRTQNPKSSLDDFTLRLEKFNSSGALFDIVKLETVCKDFIATLTADELYERVIEWSKKYDNEVFEILEGNKEYCVNILNIERTGERIRKDIVKYEDVRAQLEIFFDQLNTSEDYEDISERVDGNLSVKILEEYVKVLDLDDSQEVWFEKVKELASRFDVKVGDVAMVLRIALTKKSRSPDLYQVIQVLGEEKTVERLRKYIDMMI